MVTQELRISPDKYGREINEDVERYLDGVHNDVSRTFDAALNKLSGDLKREIQVGYLMCRIPDTIEDYGGFTGQQKSNLLNEYREVLEDPNQRKTGEFVRSVLDSVDEDFEALDDESRYWDLLKNSHVVMSSFQTFDKPVQESMVDAVDEMSRGMSEFSQKYDRSGFDGIRINDMEELHDYCHFVAGTVGEMLTDIFSYHNDISESVSENLSNYSESFGQFLQTINILKDPLEDFESESAVFIPEEVLPGTHEDIIRELEIRDPDTIIEGMNSLLEYADRQGDDARNYIELIPENSEIRGYLEVPYLLARATAREIEENPEKVAQGDLAVEREEVMAILQEAGNNEGLDQIESDINQKPLEIK